MRWTLSRPEQSLLAACAALLLAALALPGFPDAPGSNDFADQRTLFGLPCALNVLSNLPLALAGAIGLGWLRRVPRSAVFAVERGMAALFFVGLVVTAAASSFYHWAPDPLGLAVDRTGMSVAFAGLLGLLVAVQVSDRAAGTLAALLVGLGPAAAWTCLAADNVLPWAIVQFGGMALVLAFAFRRGRPGSLGVRWGWILLAYAVAKLFEAGDQALFEATGQWLSGHTLKHLAAACAAWPVIAAVAARAGGQNGAAAEVATA